MRLCKTASPCESHSVELIYGRWFEKVPALCQDTQLSGFWKKIGVWNGIFCVRVLLALKKMPQFCLICLSGSGFINFDSQESKFPVIFNMFVSMFWIAEGFGYIGVPLGWYFWVDIYPSVTKKTNLGG